VHFFIIIAPLILVTAFFTLAERKIMASIQRRRGPHIVGYIGLLQPLADGLKLLCKELIFPFKSNMFLYLAAPFIILFSSLLS